MFATIDKKIAMLFMPMLIRADCQDKQVLSIRKKSTLVNYLYSKRIKTYSKYGITKSYIEDKINGIAWERG